MRMRSIIPTEVLERIRQDMEAIDRDAQKNKRIHKEVAQAHDHFTDCPVCKGSGLHPDDPTKLCDECKGSGKILKS